MTSSNKCETSRFYVDYADYPDKPFLYCRVLSVYGRILEYTGKRWDVFVVARKGTEALVINDKTVYTWNGQAWCKPLLATNEELR
jgi:hypothetical protein